MPPNHLTPGYVPASVARPLEAVTKRIYFVDRLHVLLPSHEADLNLDELSEPGRKAPVLVPSNNKFNPVMKSRLELFQPSKDVIVELERQIGSKYTYAITRAEIAMDLITPTTKEAGSAWTMFVHHLWFPRLQARAHVSHGTTAYWGSLR